MINKRIKLYLFLVLAVVSLGINFGCYYYISLNYSPFLNLFIIISPVITVLACSLSFDYVYEKCLKLKFQDISDDYVKNYSLKKNDNINIVDSRDFNMLLNQMYSDIKKIKSENSTAEQKLKEFDKTANDFRAELESFKVASVTDLKNGQTNNGFILKKAGEVADFLFETETILKTIQINFTNSNNHIESKFKNKTKLSEHLNKLILISKDFDKIFDNIVSFENDFKSKEESVIAKITNIITNLERQSINILNAYIFSNQENIAAEGAEHSSEFEREENLQNIKNMNDSIKNEVMQIKNTLMVVFESSKTFETEFEKNADIFKQLNSYLIQIPAFISGFFEIDDNIRNTMQRDSLQLSKVFDRINGGNENIKNINLKLNTLSKTVEDLQSEIIKLKFES
ncbi:MAG TPA: hypothetical protein PKY81_00250 [bacterium]|nr:hypothetical protein [bacterium]HPN29364.1 hypothetical protein [bacterium]